MNSKPSWRDVNLTKQDVERFLQAKAATLPCPACGHPEWEIHGSEEWFTLHLDRHFIDSDSQPLWGSPAPKSVLPVIAIECASCGNLRLHTRGPVARWVAQHPGEAAQDE